MVVWMDDQRVESLEQKTVRMMALKMAQKKAQPKGTL